MWQNYPKHMMETVRKIPYVTIDAYPDREIKTRLVRPHKHTYILRKKF